MEVTGGCLCKAVRFRFSEAPIITRICWCRFCQFIGSGNGTVNVAFHTRAMTLEGELTDYRSVADSGNVMHRRFCSKCGTPMFSEAEVRPHIIFVRAGTLDDPEIAKPVMNIWTSQAPTWACMDTSLPSVPGQPPPAA